MSKLSGAFSVLEEKVSSLQIRFEKKKCFVEIKYDQKLSHCCIRDNLSDAIIDACSPLSIKKESYEKNLVRIVSWINKNKIGVQIGRYTDYDSKWHGAFLHNSFMLFYNASSLLELLRKFYCSKANLQGKQKIEAKQFLSRIKEKEEIEFQKQKELSSFVNSMLYNAWMLS